MGARFKCQNTVIWITAVIFLSSHVESGAYNRNLWRHFLYLTTPRKTGARLRYT